MRRGSLTKEQAIEIVGVEAVDKVERENCDFTGTLQTDGDEGIEFSASVSAVDKDGERCTLIAYYYQTQDALDSAGDDLSNIDWEIAGFEVQ